jgi:sulfur carrier protein
MHITVKLFATLRDFGPEIQEMKVEQNITIEEVIKTLNLPEDIPLLKIVNGVHADPGKMLKEGDVLALFPPVGGG